MRERIDQLVRAWQQTRAADPRMPVVVLVPGLVVLVGFVVLAIVTGRVIMLPILGVLVSLTLMLVLFGRRVQAAQFGQLEGQPGAAAAVLNVMRGQWFVTPAVAFTRKQDFVHRVIGRCGIVLVGEGSPPRVKELLAKERTRLSKLAGSDVPITTIMVGNGQRQTPLDRLQVTLTKLPRQLKKTEVPKLDRRLKPMDKDLPLPKGYIPNPGKKMR